MKSLIYSIIDEKDATKWKSVILNNRQKSDFMVLGSVSPLGDTLNELKEHNIDVFQVADVFKDFYIHRNSVLDIIKNDPRYSECDFFISIDSDEEIQGNLPDYLTFTDISISAIWAYYYDDPKSDTIYVGHRAFSGRNFPVWGGVVHDALIGGPSDQIFSHKFKLFHHRENFQRTKPYIEIINESADDSFETRLAFIQEACNTHTKVGKDFILLLKAYEEMHKIVVPDRVTEYAFGHQNTRLFLFKFRIALELGFIDEAKMYAAHLYDNLGQRIGIYLEWFAEKRNTNPSAEKKNTEYYVMKYMKADPERMQFMDLKRPWWK